MFTLKITIKYDEIREYYNAKAPDLPKYVATILNQANRFSQGTRPEVVGQMSDLIQEFPGSTLYEWREWYFERHSAAIDTATDRIMDMLQKMQDAMAGISKQMVREWVEDLVIVKTFIGLRCQAAILKRIAELCDLSHRLAKPEEEARGIDGYVGDTPLSIKPKTYEIMAALSEDIEVQVVYYEKTKQGITFTFDESSIGRPCP